MRKLKTITKEQVLRAIEFVSEKSGGKISTVELCYRVVETGQNALSGFNFQDNQANVKLIAGATEVFMREFHLTGDRSITIITPVADTKLNYKYCSPDWSFEEEISYQKQRGNTLQEELSQLQKAAFENSILCDITVGYTQINEYPDILDMRLPNQENDRVFDLVRVVDETYELNKVEPRFQFGRQRFQVNQFIDYLCKND